MSVFDWKSRAQKAAVIGAMVGLPLPSLAAQEVNLFLMAGGSWIQGESTQTSLGRENSIECVGFHTAIRTTSSGTPGAMVLTCKKRIDKSSPLLVKALTEQQAAEFTFKFFRPNPTGDGTTEQYYTIQSKAARIVAVEEALPSTVDASTTGLPPLESVSIKVTGMICFTFTNGGVQYCPTVSSN